MGPYYKKQAEFCLTSVKSISTFLDMAYFKHRCVELIKEYSKK